MLEFWHILIFGGVAGAAYYLYMKYVEKEERIKNYPILSFFVITLWIMFLSSIVYGMLWLNYFLGYQ